MTYEICVVFFRRFGEMVNLNLLLFAMMMLFMQENTICGFKIHWFSADKAYFMYIYVQHSTQSKLPY